MVEVGHSRDGYRLAPYSKKADRGAWPTDLRSMLIDLGHPERAIPSSGAHFEKSDGHVDFVQAPRPRGLSNVEVSEGS